MKFLGRWLPPESSLPRSERGDGSAPSEEAGDTGGATRIFSILPEPMEVEKHVNEGKKSKVLLSERR